MAEKKGRKKVNFEFVDCLFVCWLMICDEVKVVGGGGGGGMNLLLGSPCFTAMDSPLFYELDTYSELESQQQLIKNQQQQRRGLIDRRNNNQLETFHFDSTTSAAAASSQQLRLTNSRLAEQDSAAYPELADIHTPEISLDIQVMIDRFNDTPPHL